MADNAHRCDADCIQLCSVKTPDGPCLRAPHTEGPHMGKLPKLYDEHSFAAFDKFMREAPPGSKMIIGPGCYCGG